MPETPESDARFPSELGLNEFFLLSPDLLAVVDRDGVIQRVNPAWEERLGLSTEDVVGRPLLELVHPDDRDSTARVARAVRQGGRTVDFETRWPRADGEYSVVRWSVAGDPTAGWYFAIGRDVSERKAEQGMALRAATVDREYQFRQELLGELHDGTLQVLAGTGLKLETALRLLETDPRAAAGQIREVLEAVTEEQRLIRFFIDAYMEGEGNERPGRGLARTLRMVARQVQAIWQVHVTADLSVEEEPDPGVRHAICRIVQEAAVNARRHGGATQVGVRVEAAGGEVCLTVSDNGSGFGFEGEWSHDDLVRKRRGPISLRRRVQRLGGTVRITSGPGGAVVEARIPT